MGSSHQGGWYGLGTHAQLVFRHLCDKDTAVWVAVSETPSHPALLLHILDWYSVMIGRGLLLRQGVLDVITGQAGLLHLGRLRGMGLSIPPKQEVRVGIEKEQDQLRTVWLRN